MDEEETAQRRRHQRLLLEERAKKEREMEALDEMLEEEGKLVDPMKPRFSLAHSPPIVSTPPPSTAAKGKNKRLLTSPEDVQEALKKRVASNRPSVPPVTGILKAAPVGPRPATTPPSGLGSVDISSSAPVSPEASQGPSISPPKGPSSGKMDKCALMDAVHAAVKAIGAVANGTNKLNISDKTAIASHGQDILALVAQLALKYSDLEHEVCATKLQCAKMAAPPQQGSSSATAQQQTQQQTMAPDYAKALKMPKGKPPMPVQQQGPAVIFYPTEGSTLKTSDETKKALQSAVKPAESGIKITQVRRVGNSGVVVRTVSEESAQKLRDAVPPGLRVAVPKSRAPRLALRYIRAQLTGDQIIEELHRVNLADDASWPLSKFKQECKFGVSKQMGPKYLVILECSPAVRDKLVTLGRVYIGWDEAEVCDHIRSTCCSKCQQYGHPEKYCRAKELTCGRCGESGHRHTECKATTKCCATCKRFKRPEAKNHPTAAADCPARLHAEQQEAQKTRYR